MMEIKAGIYLLETIRRIYIYIKSGDLKQSKDWLTANQIIRAKHIKL